MWFNGPSPNTRESLGIVLEDIPQVVGFSDFLVLVMLEMRARPIQMLRIKRAATTVAQKPKTVTAVMPVPSCNL